jgi:predicted membrane protein (TIGR00267 family)
MPAFKLFSDLREANELTGVGELLRRYFAMNGFDGALTTLGVVFGSFISGVSEPRVVLFTVVATSIALAISGFWGSYLTEQSERRQDILQLESKMLTKLRNTKLAKAADIASWEASIVNGLSPFAMAMLIASPFALARFTLISVTTAYYSAFSLALLILFALGAFLGRVSNQSIAIMGLKMVAAGIFAVAIAFLLGGL